MGCDIHGYVQIKPCDSSSHWNSVIKLDGFNLRDYQYFANFFGVRGGFDKIIRGLPDDFDWNGDEYEEATTNDDWHSHTWATFAELQDCWVKLITTVPSIKDWTVLYSLCDILSGTYNPDNVRFVVWFDN